MSTQHAMQAAAARRSDLSLFLIKVFETLHPGEAPLQRAWYIRAICHALTCASQGEDRRLVITVPPRHLKSITAAVALVALLLGKKPALKVMVASYSQDLARLHATMSRRILESDWYRRDFPATRIAAGGNRALELVTTAGGCRKAVSVGGSTTGFGADIIIVDDCMKADEARSQTVRDETRAWFDDTLLTRLNDKANGIVISIQQRLHEDDLPAYLLDKGYKHLNLPAIAEIDETIPIGPNRFHHRGVGDLLNPERENKATLDQLHRDLGPAVFAAQYQQDPVAPGGNLLKWEWFGSCDRLPERHELTRVVQSWDTGMSAAPTSDWSVCTTWGFSWAERKWFLLDVFRQRLDFPDLKRAIVRLKKQWDVDHVLIERAGNGLSLYQEFRTTGELNPRMIRPRLSKEDRFIGSLAELEAGCFVLPQDAPWLAAFRSELKAFPNGRHDDQVDSFSQFVGYQRGHWRSIITEHTQTGRPVRTIRGRRPW